MRVEDGFQPVPYPAVHPYVEDPVLPNLLKRLIPDNYRAEIESDLIRFGSDVGGYIRDLTPLVHPPKLTQYDQWGRRIDRLDTSEGWRRLKDIGIREGLVAIAHERKYGAHSRVYGFAKSLVFSGDAHVVMCPLSMTDGAARVLELNGTEDMKRDIHSRLISRDPSVAFTSGQWMTERPGGSDVSQTETTAVSLASSIPPSSTGAPYLLNGFKWFSSATDSQVAVALARTGNASQGARSLSLFLVPLRLPLLPTPGPSSTSNGILVHRLKEKFGTHALPTAELSLNDTKGFLVGRLNEGVRSIAPVLNITRMHAAVGVLGGLSRAFAIARTYAGVRSITVEGEGEGEGGRTRRLLKETPLHVASLAKVATTYHALVHLTFGAVVLLGRSECGIADEEEEGRLRMLTPVVKAFVAEKGVSAMEECMESLGGQGYMEENVIGRLIRDGMVDRIWEGTLNVLALDLVRASGGRAGEAGFVRWGRGVLARMPCGLASDVAMGRSAGCLGASLETVAGALWKRGMPRLAPVPVLVLFGHVTAGLYLLEHVVWGYERGDARWGTDADVFVRWVEGLGAAAGAVERVLERGAGGERERQNTGLVYGRL